MNDTNDRVGSPRTPDDWNARYLGRDTPWDTGRADANLIAAVHRVGLASGRVLDIGCGSGCEAVWMAGQGFDVFGVDVAAAAIDAARRRATDAAVTATFDVGSFPAGESEFDLAYDCGCFHVGDVERRKAFVADVARLLVPGGIWICIAGSTDGPARDHGPPRLSATEIVGIVEPRFEIESLNSATYDAQVPTPARAWVGVFRRREATAR